MARAGKVRGIRPKRSLRENASRVVEVRLQEFMFWRSALDDEEKMGELHDMRIAAKRLRYALEMFDVCYPDVKPILKQLTDIQEDLGTLHDLDVLAEVLRSESASIQRATDEKARQIMDSTGTLAGKNKQIRLLLSAQGRDERWIGLTGLIGEKVSERRRRFIAFSNHWRGDAIDAFDLAVRQTVGLSLAQNAPGERAPNEFPPLLEGDPASPPPSGA